MTKVKVCDVRDLNTAEYCANIGVDFIGVHQIYAPITNDKLNLLNKIRTVSGKMKIVLVTKETNLEELFQLCKCFQWDYIQLHFELTLDYIVKVKKMLERLNHPTGVIAVIHSEGYSEQLLVDINQYVDYFLFDSSMRGGSGILSSPIALKRISKSGKDLEYFVAGGLTPENVESVINITSPFGVDVQSGVEYEDISRKHQKDLSKIKHFVEIVKKKC